MSKPVKACLADNATVAKFTLDLKEAGCDVETDKDAGTIVAKDGGTVVFRTLAKGPRGHWIVMFFESDNIKWRESNT